MYLRIQAAWLRGWRRWQACQMFLTINMRSVEIFFLASCTAFYFFFSQPAFREEQPSIRDNDWQKTDQNVKYILLWTWTPGTFAPFYKTGEGQEAFAAINCLVTECYVTADRMLFGGDLTKFDSILFHGHLMTSSDLPKARSRHQLYIFFSMESADNYPVCEEVFDGFFNWTSTYRLDSDIPYPYILIRDDNGEIVGPKRNMQWKEMAAVDDKFVLSTYNKIGAAAWFVSNCEDRSGRRELVTALQNALKPYNLMLTVFGRCGTWQCPRYPKSTCNNLLKNSYFFYMSIENSFDEDYVTEKLLKAVQNDVVPIVYGGADYSRFLPPGSYIDARKHNITELAVKINKLIHSPKEYSQYFWWKKYYSYHDAKEVENVCALCEALHNKDMLNSTKIYYDFRNWWNSDERCSSSTKYNNSGVTIGWQDGQNATGSQPEGAPDERATSTGGS